MRQSCLTRALDQWNDNHEFRLWYNSNHVISIEEDADPPKGYLSLGAYGYTYFLNSFELDKEYSTILREYLQSKDGGYGL